ncbi:MAG TPA: flavin reductase family protein [Methanomassiliicoccales archaeon]|nr:flavin reductase family protein [Methanomassiliicoccales archaeon]
MGQKNEVNPIWACRAFPAYPVVLAAVGDGADGGPRNVITIALVHMFSFNPPVLGIGISPSRFSYGLFDNSPDFTINVPGKELVEEVLFCGQHSGKDMDKFDECGFTFSKGKKVGSPIIHDCMVNLECRKVNKVDAGDHTWFLGEVVHAEMENTVERERALLYWAGEFRVVGDIIRRR